MGDKYRIFISYSREDRDNAFEALKKHPEEKLKVKVLCDDNISAGIPFSDSIKGLIIHAHIFMPLRTTHSQKSPWVHQETGYAIARKIPVLLIAVKGSGLPAQMIAQLISCEPAFRY